MDSQNKNNDIGGVMNSQNKNLDMAGLMAMLSKMDKKDLEQGLNKVSKLLKSTDADQIINEIKKRK